MRAMATTGTGFNTQKRRRILEEKSVRWHTFKLDCARITMFVFKASNTGKW